MLKTTALVVVGALILFAVLGALSSMHAPAQSPTLTRTLSPSPVRGDLVITGPPTVTASFIDHILHLAHSPAEGIGSLLYQLGSQEGIDPAFALAFFHHESDYGRAGVAATTHSLGNIRCTAGWTCDPSGGYRWYPTWSDGVRDWYALLHDVYLSQGLRTLPAIIHVYAPSADHNDEAAYVQAVQADVTAWRQGEVQP